MDIYSSVCKKRTIRLFKQDKVDYKILEKSIDAARLSSSARNSQPLEYVVVDDTKILSKILHLINFGGFITEDRKAKKGSEPTALIVVIVRQEAGEYYKYDIGIAAQNISLVLFENGIGACMMGSIDGKGIQKTLNIPDGYFVDMVIAVGYPNEEPKTCESDGSLGYYRKERLHVPKRKLNEVLHRNSF